MEPIKHIITSQLEYYPRFLFVHTPNMPFSIVSFWLRAGSRFDPRGKEGLAHLLEHLLMKRTERFPEATKRLKYMEENGILYGAFTSQDPVYYYCVQQPQETLGAFELLLEGLQGSLVKKDDLEAEKKVVFDELKRQKNNPSAQIWYLANKALWPGTMLSREVLGTVKTVKAISIEDAEKFRKKYYTTENLTILILSPNRQDAKIIEKKVAGLNGKVGLVFPKERFSNPRKYIVQKRERNSVQVATSFLTRGNKTKEEVVALHFIKNYLAGGWSSRLVQRLRVEENLTYWVNGFIRDLPDTGLIRFTFTTQKKTLKDALAAFMEEANKIKTKKIPCEDIRKHNKSLKTGILASALRPRRLLWHYGWSVLVQKEKPAPLGDYINSLDTLSPEKIQDVAQEQLRKLSLAATGPITEKEINNII